MGYILTGDQQRIANKRIAEILRQFGQDEYPYDPGQALDALQAFHEGRFEAVGDAILRLISGGETLVLDETDGQETISGAKEVFAYIDPNFKNWGANEASEASGKTSVSVCEMAQDATFSQMFGSVSDDYNRLCLTQSQIVGFLKKHRNWLHPDGWATFFLFKSNGKLFVARVDFDGRERLNVYVYRFEGAFVWNAGYRHRLVLPQLTLGH